jgi:hypothetical protein
MENKLEIGFVTIKYKEDGTIANAGFQPTMNLPMDALFLEQLRSVNCSTSSDDVKHNSDMIFSAFFNKINEIELADRTEWEVKSEIESCEKYDNGNVKSCKIKYVYQKFNI